MNLGTAAHEHILSITGRGTDLLTVKTTIVDDDVLIVITAVMKPATPAAGP